MPASALTRSWLLGGDRDPLEAKGDVWLNPLSVSREMSDSVLNASKTFPAINVPATAGSIFPSTIGQAALATPEKSPEIGSAFLEKRLTSSRRFVSVVGCARDVAREDHEVGRPDRLLDRIDAARHTELEGEETASPSRTVVRTTQVNRLPSSAVSAPDELTRTRSPISAENLSSSSLGIQIGSPSPTCSCRIVILQVWP